MNTVFRLLAMCVIVAAFALVFLLSVLLGPFVALFGGQSNGTTSGGGNMSVVQAAEAMVPFLRLGPPDNYDVRYDTSAPIIQQAIGYWSKLCPGCSDWQNGNLQCTMFVAAAFALAQQPLPNVNLNAIDYWAAYRNEPGWLEIPSGTGMPMPGDIVIWSSPFFGGVGHMGVVVNVVPPSGSSSGSLTFAEGNGPQPLVSFPLQPNLQIVPWQQFTTMGYIRNTRFATVAGNASQHLMRISQLDCSQYVSQGECNLWAYSTCSAAAMTEVLNAYGGHFHITDILQIEARLGAISPSQGLLYPGGIAQTMAKFGFQTNWSNSGFSLEQIVEVASSGTPVMVSFPPDRYSGGHILVVRGGQLDPASGMVSTVLVADSSSWDRTAISRAQFLAWWGGFFAISTPQVTSGPTIPNSPYVAVAQQDALIAGISSTIFVKQIAVESGFNPTAVSPAGAEGIAQLMPATAASLGVNPFNPTQALATAARLMASQLAAYQGDYARALAAYNAGGATVNQAISLYGADWLPHMPAETQHYVAEVLG